MRSGACFVYRPTAPVDVRDLQRALRRKLDAVEDRRSHHVFYWVTIDGLEFRAAKFSHSSRGQLPNFILSDTAQRLKLSRAELDELVDCPLSRDGFLELWKTR